MVRRCDPRLLWLSRPQSFRGAGSDGSFPICVHGERLQDPSDEIIGAVVRPKLGSPEGRVREILFTHRVDVVKLIASRCTELETGDRMIGAILTKIVLLSISQKLLTRLMEGYPVERVRVSVSDGEFDSAFE